MGEQAQHPYNCMNRGCSNGFESTFYAAPPEWFSGKGINTPKNCPDCKSWKKSQSDSMHRCKSCGYSIRQSRGVKLMHHKKEGVYTPPSECRQCKDGEKPPKTLRKRPPPPGALEPLRPAQILTVTPYTQLSAYRQSHYGKHVPGHAASQVGQAMQNGKRVSATTLVGPNASSHDLYAAGSEIAARTDSGVYQYESRGNILKVTIVNGTHVELTLFGPRDDGTSELLSSYDEMTVEAAKAKLKENHWT